MTVDHRRALSFVFARPQWPNTVLMLTLAVLVPLVGPIVAMGYQAVLVEHIARRGDDNSWPLFDFARLADYLQRGLRVFLVSMVLSFVVTPIALVVLFVGNGVAVLLYDADAAWTIAVVGCVVILESIVFVLVMAASLALMTPLWLRACLDSDLGAAFDFAFVRDFLARCWKQLLVSHTLLMLASVALMLAGMLACFVGMFPAIALTMLVQAHVYAQLYRVYLSRGGRDVAAAAGAVSPPPAPPPPAPPPPAGSYPPPGWPGGGAA
jgi:hypothetical protein